MVININYLKRKNQELFKNLENPDLLFLSKTQNYIPIYNRFFSLNETNYNNINLNHPLYLDTVKSNIDDNSHLFTCLVKNINNNKVKEREIFFKLAPLLDPYKYLIGKYNINDCNLFNLPKLENTENICNPKIMDNNNSAYIDGFFLFLASTLIHNNNFIHGVEYYGSYLSHKNNFTINIFDDLEYLNDSEFFIKNKNNLFFVDDYQHLFNEENTKLKPINIEYNSTMCSKLSIHSFHDDVFEDIFEENKENKENIEGNNNNLDEITNEMVDVTNMNFFKTNENNNVTLKTSSTCSSRSSHTDEEIDNKDCENCCEEMDDEESIWEDDEEDNGEYEEEDSDEEEEIINAVIPQFPVQVIAMEYCENTFDDLILNNDLKKEEWYSAFMQIIMTLIIYQKSFHFTHNDLHTNNVMYSSTDKKYIYYSYKKVIYKVPTFGRIFKIIDFGRSIYKFNGKLFCSDSFQVGGDAATQYNTEPYFNDKKPRLEPNYSFDLCRLACSIFDYVVEDFNEVKNVSTCKDPVKKLIIEWCLDDKGINMLYKHNGADRYPDFKLYKMIARCVHNHTPHVQLERPEFKAFSIFKGEVPNNGIIDIDAIPVYV
jgi:hypothetical protein